MTDNNSSDTTSERPRVSAFEALKRHTISHKIEVLMWATRLLTMFFTFIYFLSIFGNPYNAYYKALLGNAAISALRLHQRQPRISFSKEFIAAVLVEDSFHYLSFSMIFLYVTPVSLALLPVFLFALVHFSSYSLTILDAIGQNSWWGARLFISIIELQSRNMLRLVAYSEILLMPLTVVLIFLGRAGLLTPFVYYQFLMMRYKSLRNPYTRNMFYELRVKLESLANSSRTPAAIRNAILNFISFVSRLAPPQIADPQ